MKGKISWVFALFATVFVTMFVMWIIKKVAIKYEIPVVSTMAKEV